jgi:hypothetical protein
MMDVVAIVAWWYGDEAVGGRAVVGGTGSIII